MIHNGVSEMTPLNLQIGKAEKVASAWGVNPRRLKLWLDEGLVKYKQRGSGRGSMRLLTDESLLDVYLASQLSHDLAQSHVSSCIRAARRHYGEWLRSERRNTWPVFVVFKIDHAPLHTTEVRLPLESALASIMMIRERLTEQPQVSRGRPRRNWRREFEEDMTEIGRSLRASAASRRPVEEDIRAYRSRLRATEEVHVTVPT
jgi:DNA-binding transcriptional MerR regulator